MVTLRIVASLCERAVKSQFMMIAAYKHAGELCVHPSCKLAGLYNKMSSYLSVLLTDCNKYLKIVFYDVQRVMDEYSGDRPTSKGGRPFGLASPAGSSASQWESTEHVQTNISHLSSTLAGVAACHLWNTFLTLNQPGNTCA